MKSCIFTICAKNYIGLAQVLEKSLKKNNSEYPFYIFVADEISDVERAGLPDNVIECKEALKDFIGDDKWSEMAFKYNLTEFCTSVKPSCFNYLFQNLGFNKSIYLDPDIFVFSSFNPVFSDLDQFKIILTPHITTFNVKYKGERSEKGLLSTGVFNLGFLALTNSEHTSKMLSWWAERLEMQCYIDVLDSYFTDQRWMDFLPCFFDSKTLSVSSHLGLNVAPWNFFEREVYEEDERWLVKLRDDSGESDEIQSESVFPLIFVHFSGYDYKNLISGSIVQNNIQDLGTYQDIDVICRLYGDFLRIEEKTFNQFIKYPYSYGQFENGIQITHFQRRIYRGLIEAGEAILSPFSIGKGSFYSKLSDRKLLVRDPKDNVDKINKLNMPDTGGKLKKINFLMRIVFKVIGIKRYSLILRLMRPYSRIENQIHLLDSKYGSNLK